MTSGKDTPVFNPPPCIMVIGLDDAVAKACADAARPIPALRVRRAGVARDRVLTTWPLVILASPADEAEILDAARAVGATLILTDTPVSAETLRNAVVAAARARR
jgi:hypothetical protein